MCMKSTRFSASPARRNSSGWLHLITKRVINVLIYCSCTTHESTHLMFFISFQELRKHHYYNNNNNNVCHLFNRFFSILSIIQNIRRAKKKSKQTNQIKYAQNRTSKLAKIKNRA